MWWQNPTLSTHVSTLTSAVKWWRGTCSGCVSHGRNSEAFHHIHYHHAQAKAETKTKAKANANAKLYCFSVLAPSFPPLCLRVAAGFLCNEIFLPHAHTPLSALVCNVYLSIIPGKQAICGMQLRTWKHLSHIVDMKTRNWVHERECASLAPISLLMKGSKII